MKDKLKKLLNCIKSFLLKNKWIIIMNIIIFIMTVFIESLYMYQIKVWLMIVNTLIFIIVPTFIFNLKYRIRTKDILLSMPILYILFLIFLGFCTQRDIFYITSGSNSVDTIPNFIDALFVVFVFTFVEYFTTLFTTKVILKEKKKVTKKKTKKVQKKED
jgi:hypothetical protein